MSIKEIKAKLLKALRDSRPNKLALIDRYIEEAEHQDGIGYWAQFENASELLEDFDLFAEYYEMEQS